MNKIITLFLIILALAVSSARIARPEVVNHLEGDTDGLILLGSKVLEGGQIYATLTDGKAAIEGTFMSTKKPQEIVEVFEEYLASKGKKGKIMQLSEHMQILRNRQGLKMGRDIREKYPAVHAMIGQLNAMSQEEGQPDVPMWMWSGDIDGEKKQILIMPGLKKAVLVKIISHKENGSFLKGRKIISRQNPEFHRIGNLHSSREVIKGDNPSAFFHYSCRGSARQAMHSAKANLRQAGWKEYAAGLDAGSINEGMNIMTKDNLVATLFASREKGETDLIASVHQNPQRDNNKEGPIVTVSPHK